MSVWTLRQARVAIVIGGCLGMAFTQLMNCSASIQYARSLGGNGLHIGLLGALPTGMLFVQFLAAWLGNRLTYRRPVWFWCNIVGRLMCIPAVAGAWLFPEISDNVWLWTLIGVWAVSQAVQHFASPLWLSWMGDYLPHRGLSHYWGVRYLWMQLAAAGSLIIAGYYLRFYASNIRDGFAMIMLVCSLMGVIDILLFLKIKEPPVTRVPDAGLWELLSAPFRHAGFRSFIGFTSFWNLASMIGAPFISMYLLDYVGMSADQLLWLWVFSWVGGALCSTWIGRTAERYGSRFVMILSIALKSINMIALLLVPQRPGLVFWLLGPIFMLDMALNTGIAIATNSYLLKNSPTANRTTYIAAGTAVAGLVGGVTSVASGIWLASMTGWQTTISGHLVTGYHVLFLVSILLRFVAVGLVSLIHEPTSTPVWQVFAEWVGIERLRALQAPRTAVLKWTRKALPERVAPQLNAPLSVPLAEAARRTA
ncbi:MFS transporter [Planctomicrobium sp. SH664]|uniref:MFS transporter n=1 Tax=Planctomicrobium sp. SH664 TaxID=3448125 RepID=UPI003F5CB771